MPPHPAPTRHEKPTFAADFKRFFVRGLAILLPSVLTLWIVWQAYLFLDRQVAEPINSGIRRGVLWVIPRTFNDNKLPPWFVVNEDEVKGFRAMLQRQGTLDAQALLQLPDPGLKEELRAVKFKRFWDAHWYFRFIGLIVAVTLIYLAGRILGGFIGRTVYERLEQLLTRIPVIKQVYPHVKQVVEMIFGEKQIAFKKVVLVEYPRKGIWSIGFVTSSGMSSVSDASGEPALTVFIPSTPTPFTGFTITVPRSEARELAITVDEALRFILTGGVLVPGKQSLEVTDTIADADREATARRAGTGKVISGGAQGSVPEAAAGMPPALTGKGGDGTRPGQSLTKPE
jgi:uncharacterized membrane protein